MKNGPGHEMRLSDKLSCRCIYVKCLVVWEQTMIYIAPLIFIQIWHSEAMLQNPIFMLKYAQNPP